MGPQKIILFGGTFDPPHNGHMTLLAGAIEAVRPDLVLVEPAGTPPHKRVLPPAVSGAGAGYHGDRARRQKLYH